MLSDRDTLSLNTQMLSAAVSHFVECLPHYRGEARHYIPQSLIAKDLHRFDYEVFTNSCPNSILYRSLLQKDQSAFRCPNCLEAITTNLFAVIILNFFPQIIIGMVLPQQRSAIAKQVQIRPESPTPLIQLVKRKATMVAQALRTKQTPTKPSPII